MKMDLACSAASQLQAVDCITDGVAHTQLVKFCMAVKLQFITLGVVQSLSGEAAATVPVDECIAAVLAAKEGWHLEQPEEDPAWYAISKMVMQLYVIEH